MLKVFIRLIAIILFIGSFLVPLVATYQLPAYFYSLLLPTTFVLFLISSFLLFKTSSYVLLASIFIIESIWYLVRWVFGNFFVLTTPYQGIYFWWPVVLSLILLVLAVKILVKNINPSHYLLVGHIFLILAVLTYLAPILLVLFGTSGFILFTLPFLRIIGIPLLLAASYMYKKAEKTRLIYLCIGLLIFLAWRIVGLMFFTRF